MAIALATVTKSISNLQVSGLIIKDIGTIPVEVGSRSPMLIPAYPLVTDITLERDSFGGGSTAKMTLSYTLNYIFCYVPIGAGRVSVLEYYDDMVSMATAILDAVIAIDTFDGGIDIQPLPLTAIGVTVADPAGNEYLGANYGFRVMEFIN